MQTAAQATVEVGCTPAPSGAAQIVDAITAARTDIRVQAYAFTSAPILGALAAAKRRGIDVQVVLDKINDQKISDARSSSIMFLANAGVPVWIGAHSDIEREKLLIIDHHIVIGMSFKTPVTAQAASSPAQARNLENVTFTDSMEVAAWFLSNWTARRDASVLFDVPEQAVNSAQTRGHDTHAPVGEGPERILEAAD